MSTNDRVHATQTEEAERPFQRIRQLAWDVNKSQLREQEGEEKRVCKTRLCLIEEFRICGAQKKNGKGG